MKLYLKEDDTGAVFGTELRLSNVDKETAKQFIAKLKGKNAKKWLVDNP